MSGGDKQEEEQSRRVRMMERVLEKASEGGTIWAETWRGEGVIYMGFWGRNIPGGRDSSARAEDDNVGDNGCLGGTRVLKLLSGL